VDKSGIDAKIIPMPVIWESYNSWMVGDTQLDWDGPEVGQGTFLNHSAMGTALAWTTDDKTEKFYYELNGQLGLGPHFWILDMTMDCSQTDNGWFELNTIYSIGGTKGFVKSNDPPAPDHLFFESSQFPSGFS
jgi:alpha-amylase